MEKIDIYDLKKLARIRRPIGIGSTAICFLLSNKDVVKLFYSKHSGKHLEDKLDELSKTENESFITPKILVTKNNECIGYITPYINGKTIKTISGFTKLSTFTKNYDDLVANTRNFSENKYIIGDINTKNIIFDGKFHVIDLDEGYFTLDSSYDVFTKNITRINKAIIYSIFNASYDEILLFYDHKLQKLYNKTIFDNYYYMIEFLGRLKELTKDNVKIKTIRSDISYTKEYNGYFRIF